MHDATIVPLKLDAGGSLRGVLNQPRRCALRPQHHPQRHARPRSRIDLCPNGQFQLLATKAGTYLQATAEKIYLVEIPPLPETTMLSGPWKFCFRQAPRLAR